VQALGENETVAETFNYLASDGALRSNGALTITVQGTNDTPDLVRCLTDVQLTKGKAFSWQVPAGSFRDVDRNDKLTYTATLSDGKALPTWLKFDAATQTFSGTAPASAKGGINVRVTASDGHGECSTASDVFQISVGNKTVLPKGNEGVGNGEDPPPPGHDCNQNDGGGSSPGHPGSQGGHQDRDDDDRDGKRGQGHDKEDGKNDDHRNRGFAYLDLSKVNGSGREKDQGQRDAQHSYESNDFYKRWAEMDRALGQLLADDNRGGWLDPKHGADLSCLKGIGLAGGNVKLGAGGCDNFSLMASNTELKNFKGLQEGVCKL
jgi:hypothetical protein